MVGGRGMMKRRREGGREGGKEGRVYLKQQQDVSWDVF